MALRRWPCWTKTFALVMLLTGLLFYAAVFRVSLDRVLHSSGAAAEMQSSPTATLKDATGRTAVATEAGPDVLPLRNEEIVAPLPSHEAKWDDPVEALRTFWLRESRTLSEHGVLFPVGGRAVMEAAGVTDAMTQRKNRPAGVAPSGGKPLCGSALLRALRLSFSVSEAKWSHPAPSSGSGDAVLELTVDTSPSSSDSARHDDILLSGRAVVTAFGDTKRLTAADRDHHPGVRHRLPTVVMAANVTRCRRSQQGERGTAFCVTFGPVPNHIVTAFASSSPGGGVPFLRVQYDILCTWVGPFFLGQQWILPDRNDNPPLAEKLRKCLALTLVGDCERFGVTLATGVLTWPLRGKGFREATTHHGGAGDDTDTRRLCRPDEVGKGPGYWEPLDAANAQPTGFLAKASALLKDVAQLNSFPLNVSFGGATAWRWQQHHCRIRLYDKTDVHTCAQRRSIRSIGLFGDSMVVEFFQQLAQLFGVAVTQGKHRRLRFMEFTSRPSSSSAGGVPLRVRFSRSYTTREGHSVIASPTVILSQLEAGGGHEVILGNFAVLHWQQNMRDLAAWRQNLKLLSQLLTPSNVSIRRGDDTEAPSSRDATLPQQAQQNHALHRRKRPWEGNAYYLSPTLIQMGRTQGLEPFRTAAFARAAEEELRYFQMVRPLALSESRRESAYDGQHWACYHTYGGVSMMIAQLWLNQLCNSFMPL